MNPALLKRLASGTSLRVGKSADEFIIDRMRLNIIDSGDGREGALLARQSIEKEADASSNGRVEIPRTSLLDRLNREVRARADGYCVDSPQPASSVAVAGRVDLNPLNQTLPGLRGYY